MISTERKYKVINYVKEHGIDAAVEKFSVKKESVERYCRGHLTVIRKKKQISDTKIPKVLFFDIETAPTNAEVWNMWNTNVGASQIMSMGYILCYSAKWLGGANIINDTLTCDEAISCDDKRVVMSLWSLFDEADILIAHNGEKFDRKVANTQFLVNGLTPPSPYRIIDTLKALRNEFKFPHNKLDFITEVLGLTRKIQNEGHQLWTKARSGDELALKTMQEYCDGDIVSLEEAYLVLQPWIRHTVNFGLYYNSETPVCHSCGSADIHLTDKYVYTSVSKFPVYKCSCGAYSRSRYSSLSLKKRQSLLTGIGKGFKQLKKYKFGPYIFQIKKYNYIWYNKKTKYMIWSDNIKNISYSYIKKASTKKTKEEIDTMTDNYLTYLYSQMLKEIDGKISEKNRTIEILKQKLDLIYSP